MASYWLVASYAWSRNEKKTIDEQRAAWSRERAAELWARASALEADVSGCWRARSRRRRVADRLIKEAWFYERHASRLDGLTVGDDSLPF